jgi:hypothetical protein
MYPDSQMAEEGFQRLLERVLPEGDISPPAPVTEELNYN